ncbi:MAG: radical SAM protein [Alphaproteobacteria bacterium]|nr:radical SAM protein [Alphaproteobacteria bacterium]
MTPKVLVVTGGMFSFEERSLVGAVRKQAAALRASSGGWLDIHLKVVALERVLAMRRFQASRAFARAPYRDAVARMFAEDPAEGVPELTEVLLCTLLEAEGLPFEVRTYSALHDDEADRARVLAECPVIFASTTLIRDLSELRALLAPLKRPDNRVVAGGALVSMLHHDWPGCPEVDVIAAGYGERLVPALAGWIRSDFETLEPPDGGALERRGGALILRSGVPQGRSLDHLPAPDWALAARVHGRGPFPLVSYESVRGCPYRCAFCNYPYLFDDAAFRLRSAEQIADDWARLVAGGASWISCLDSLFTVPRKRLEQLCARLLSDGTRVNWICYARADDLRDPALVRLLLEAGCRQVQIGVESGSQQQLDHMDKRCTVDQNARALANCRAEGLTSLVTLIVGFPGETAASLAETRAFLAETPPDFCFVTPFSAKYVGIPILEPAAKARFGLVTHDASASSFPPWRHATMDAVEAVDHVRDLNLWMMRERIALEGGIFYRGALGFRAEDRDALLDFQRDLLGASPWLGRLMAGVRGWTRGKVETERRALLG